MELSRTISLFPHVSRFITLTFAAAMVLPPSLPSQTAEELIGDACHNELQQGERRTLWSYVAERRSNNHVFREQVIETVDAPVRHLLAVDGQPPTSGQIKEENDRHQRLLTTHLGGKRSGNSRTMRIKRWKNYFALFPGPLFLRIRARKGSPKE